MTTDLKILEILLNQKNLNNFYVEAGANDGIIQSNTILLEKNYGWSGICVEPNINNYEKLKNNRSGAVCINAALVSSDYKDSTIRGIFNSSSVSRANGLMSGCTEEHLSDFPDWICEVPAMTLTNILVSNNAPKNLGFLSLDVENYEIEALSGIDFSVWRPQIIMMEIGKWYIQEILENHIQYMMTKNYSMIHNTVSYYPEGVYPHCQVSDHDFVFIDNKII